MGKKRSKKRSKKGAKRETPAWAGAAGESTEEDHGGTPPGRKSAGGGGPQGQGLGLFFGACAVAVAAIVGIATLVSGPSGEVARRPGPSLTDGPSRHKTICDNRSPALLDMTELRSEPYPVSIDRKASYEALVTTSCGTMEFELFADAAPIAVSNFIHLAKDQFYYGQVFHRIDTALGIIQIGDPGCPVDVAGCGTGGPGYTIPDELEGGHKSTAGTVAMVDTEGPDSSGSEFLIRVNDHGPLAPEEGTIFGELVGRHSFQVAKLIMSIPTKVAPNATGSAPADFPSGEEWVYITKIEIVRTRG